MEDGEGSQTTQGVVEFGEAVEVECEVKNHTESKNVCSPIYQNWYTVTAELFRP